MPRTSRATSVPPRARSRTAVVRARTVTPRRVSRVAIKKVAPVSVEEVLRVHSVADPVEALIRKHAPARAARLSARPPIAYYLVALAVVALVVFGWWLTLDRNLQAQRGQVDPTEPGMSEILQGGMTQLRGDTSLVPPVIAPEPTPRAPSAFEQRLQDAQTP
jgi:hypothetical protein